MNLQNYHCEWARTASRSSESNDGVAFVLPGLDTPNHSDRRPSWCRGFGDQWAVRPVQAPWRPSNIWMGLVFFGYLLNKLTWLIKDKSRKGCKNITFLFKIFQKWNNIFCKFKSGVTVFTKEYFCQESLKEQGRENWGGWAHAPNADFDKFVIINVAHFSRTRLSQLISRTKSTLHIRATIAVSFASIAVTGTPTTASVKLRWSR